MNQLTLADLHQPLCQLACDAGVAIMQIYQGEQPLNTRIKDDDSPVTAADIAAHQLIAHRLQALTPHIPLLSEEAPPDWHERQHWRRYWLIDPLDGTKDFLARTGEFTVNIALIEHGQPVLAVVHVPPTQITYSAINGSAWKQQDGQTRQIRVKTASQPRIVVSRSAHKDARMTAWLAQQTTEYELCAVGSSLKFCLVAEGAAQCYPRFAPTHTWDTAAGQAVAQAAGADIQDWQGNPLDYTPRESVLNPGFKVFIPGDTTLNG